jgi:hypothetical protein
VWERGFTASHIKHLPRAEARYLSKDEGVFHRSFVEARKLLSQKFPTAFVRDIAIR